MDITPRRGAVVTDLSIDDAEETYAVRVALEALAARHAVAKLTDADLGEIKEAFEGMVEAQRSDDLRAFIDADHVFHSRLYRASHRDRLIRNISELVDRSRRYSPHTYRLQPLDARLDAHRRILDAIEARDAVLVERLTAEHMAAAAARLVSALKQEAEEPARARQRDAAAVMTLRNASPDAEVPPASVDYDGPVGLDPANVAKQVPLSARKLGRPG